MQARAVPGGAALRFQEAEWRYHDSLGNAGRIDRRGVTRFSQRPSDPDSPPEPTLVVQSGAMLTLFEHHFGCTVLVDTVDGRTVLRIRRSFSYPGHPGRKDEYDVPLWGRRAGRGWRAFLKAPVGSTLPHDTTTAKAWRAR